MVNLKALYKGHHHYDVIKWNLFSASLALYAGNSPVTGELPTQRPVTRSFDASLICALNKRSSKQSWGWFFDAIRSSWHHCDVLFPVYKWPNYWSIWNNVEIVTYRPWLSPTDDSIFPPYDIATISYGWPIISSILLSRFGEDSQTHPFDIAILWLSHSENLQTHQYGISSIVIFSGRFTISSVWLILQCYLIRRLSNTYVWHKHIVVISYRQINRHPYRTTNMHLSYTEKFMISKYIVLLRYV